MTMPPFRKIAVFGVGLIGGSFALGLKKAGAVEQIVGAGRSRQSLERARELGIIDVCADSAAQAVDGADLVLIAAPVAQTGAILAAILPHLQPGAVVTDAGSTKTDVVAAARDALGSRIGADVDDAQFPRPLQRLPRTPGAHDLLDRTGLFQAQGEGTADQANTENGNLAERRRHRHTLLPVRCRHSASAFFSAFRKAAFS